MTSAQPLCSNFTHLGEHDDQLLRLGLLAERYFPEDPNTSLIKLRQLTELLVQMIAAKVGLYESPAETQFDLLRRLRDHGLVPRRPGHPSRQYRRRGRPAR
jgi:type I restriction enzyme R subunit